MLSDDLVCARPHAHDPAVIRSEAGRAFQEATGVLRGRYAAQMERQNANKPNPPARFRREPSPAVDALATAVIGAAIAVHRELGPGFLEAVYEEALALELGERAISFARQVSLPVFYREHAIGESRLDFLIGGLLVVELKAVEELRTVHRAQVLSYLRAGDFELGLLMNFNVPLLPQGLKRVVWTQ